MMLMPIIAAMGGTPSSLQAGYESERLTNIQRLRSRLVASRASAKYPDPTRTLLSRWMLVRRSDSYPACNGTRLVIVPVLHPVQPVLRLRRNPTQTPRENHDHNADHK